MQLAVERQSAIAGGVQMALTDDAHNLVRTHFANKAKRVAVDATCGNGFDTEFLVELGF